MISKHKTTLRERHPAGTAHKLRCRLPDGAPDEAAACAKQWARTRAGCACSKGSTDAILELPSSNEPAMKTLPIHLDQGFRNRVTAKYSGLQAAKRTTPGGMACPQCGIGKTQTIDSRPVNDGTYRRRRVCAICEFRFTTYELYRPDVILDFQI